jgi:hypothetical protein
MKPGKGREQYNVDIYDEGNIKCSCPDFRFRSKEKNIVCKHICFVICRVGNILNPRFFDTKILDDISMKLVVDAVADMIDSRGTYVIPASQIAASKIPVVDFSVKSDCSIDSDTVCPICIDSFEDSAISTLRSCPACKNIVHDHCINMWMETRDTCVFCRSDIWKKYKK